MFDMIYVGAQVLLGSEMLTTIYRLEKRSFLQDCKLLYPLNWDNWEDKS